MKRLTGLLLVTLLFVAGCQGEGEARSVSDVQADIAPTLPATPTATATDTATPEPTLTPTLEPTTTATATPTDIPPSPTASPTPEPTQTLEEITAGQVALKMQEFAQAGYENIFQLDNIPDVPETYGVVALGAETSIEMAPAEVSRMIASAMNYLDWTGREGRLLIVTGYRQGAYYLKHGNLTINVTFTAYRTYGYDRNNLDTPNITWLVPMTTGTYTYTGFSREDMQYPRIVPPHFAMQSPSNSSLTTTGKVPSRFIIGGGTDYLVEGTVELETPYMLNYIDTPSNSERTIDHFPSWMLGKAVLFNSHLSIITRATPTIRLFDLPLPTNHAGQVMDKTYGPPIVNGLSQAGLLPDDERLLHEQVLFGDYFFVFLPP